MNVVLKEARATLALALPIVVGQVSQMLMGVTDSIMIGRLGAVPLAVSAFVGGVFAVFFVVGLGLLQPVAVLASRERGAGDPAACARWLQHGVVLSVLASATGIGLMLALSAWFDRMGQAPEVIAGLEPFYTLISVSLAPALVFQVFRQYAEALGRPWIPMAIMLGSVGLNVVLNWILIYGNLGSPAFGLAGAAWATLASRVVSVAVIVAWMRREKALRAGWPATWTRHLRAEKFREMLRIGVPAAVMLFFEVGAFVMAALMVGWLGAKALAAHQIALSCVGFVFMFPLGLSMATSMRVGKATGEGRLDLARPIAGGALGLSCLIMSLSAAGFAVGGEWLASGFVEDAEVVTLAAKLLVVAAIFQLFDGAQVIMSGALRGLTDVRVPAAITFVAYWMLAIPCGYALGIHTALGAVGLWAGLATGLAVAALLLGRRFLKLTR